MYLLQRLALACLNVQQVKGAVTSADATHPAMPTQSTQGHAWPILLYCHLISDHQISMHLEKTQVSLAKEHCTSPMPKIRRLPWHQPPFGPSNMLR